MCQLIVGPLNLDTRAETRRPMDHKLYGGRTSRQTNMRTFLLEQLQGYYTCIQGNLVVVARGRSTLSPRQTGYSELDTESTIPHGPTVGNEGRNFVAGFNCFPTLGRFIFSPLGPGQHCCHLKPREPPLSVSPSLAARIFYRTLGTMVVRRVVVLFAGSPVHPSA